MQKEKSNFYTRNFSTFSTGEFTNSKRDEMTEEFERLNSILRARKKQHRDLYLKIKEMEEKLDKNLLKLKNKKKKYDSVKSANNEMKKLIIKCSV